MITLLLIFLIFWAVVITIAIVAVAVTIGVILFKRQQWKRKKYLESTGFSEGEENADEEGGREMLLPVIPGTVSLDRVDAFLYSVRNYVPKYKIESLKLALLRVPEDKFTEVSMTPLRNPVTVLLFSIFFGIYGVDRFYMCEPKKAMLKWFLWWTTLGIWPLVDIFLCNEDVKELNLQTLIDAAHEACLSDVHTDRV